MIKVNFINYNEVIIQNLFKYDYGQELEISGIDLPENFEVHFETDQENAIVVNGTFADGVGKVKIPDLCLMDSKLNFSAWIYVEENGSGNTVKTITFYLNDRQAPSDQPSDPEEVEKVKSLAEYVKENADKVSEAEKVGQDLLQMAENGEFDGADGKDYILTETDKTEIAEAIPVDDTLSATSTKPLQNKVVKEHFDKVQDILADGKLKDIICFTSEQEATDGQYTEYVRPNGKFKQALLDKEFYILIFALAEPIIDGETIYWGIYIVTKQDTVDVGHIPEISYCSDLIDRLERKVQSQDGTISQITKNCQLMLAAFDSLNSSYNEMRDNMPREISNNIYPVGIIIQFADNLDHSSFLGFTWERCLVGRTPVGIDTNDTDFSEIGKQLGEKTHLLTDTEAPKLKPRGSTSIVSDNDNDFAGPSYNGLGEPHNNIQPSEVVAFWKRVK